MRKHFVGGKPQGQYYYSRAQVFVLRLNCRHKCILGGSSVANCSALSCNKGLCWDQMSSQLTSDSRSWEKWTPELKAQLACLQWQAALKWRMLSHSLGAANEMPSQQQYPEPLWYIPQLFYYVNLLEMDLQMNWVEGGTSQNEDEGEMLCLSI